MGWFKALPDHQDHLGQVQDHLEAFGTFTYARNASGAQRCESMQVLGHFLKMKQIMGDPHEIRSKCYLK